IFAKNSSKTESYRLSQKLHPATCYPTVYSRKYYGDYMEKQWKIIPGEEVAKRRLEIHEQVMAELRKDAAYNNFTKTDLTGDLQIILLAIAEKGVERSGGLTNSSLDIDHARKFAIRLGEQSESRQEYPTGTTANFIN